MPIPVIAAAVALLQGGTLVAHAGGGAIVSGAAGYITGTYLSGGALAATGSAIGAGVLSVVAMGAKLLS